MSDELTFSGGGRISVEMEAVRRAAAWMGRCSAETERAIWILRLVDTRHPVTMDPSRWSASGIEDEIETALYVLRRESRRLSELAEDVEAAWNRYFWGDLMANRAIDLLKGATATTAGTLTRSALLDLFISAPWLVAVIGFGATHASKTATGSETGKGAGKTFDPSRLLTDPRAVTVARDLVEHTDDFIRGTLGIPPLLSALLDDDATGLLGHQETTALIAGAAAAFGMRETPVTVHAVASSRSITAGVREAPSTLAGHVTQIPNGKPKDGRVVVEQVLDEDGKRQWNVYLGGTDLTPGQPMDLLSDVRSTAGLDSGALRAAEQAMAAAGVQPGDRVSFVGYSLGGLLASQLAVSGRWDTQAVLTVGSPGSFVEIPEGIPQLALEHTEDIVTSLNGKPRDDGPVTVTRSALDGELGDDFLGGHHLTDYIETAAITDEDAGLDIRTAQERARILSAMGGTVVASTTFAAERVVADSARSTPPSSLVPAPTPGPVPVPGR